MLKAPGSLTCAGRFPSSGITFRTDVQELCIYCWRCSPDRLITNAETLHTYFKIQFFNPVLDAIREHQKAVSKASVNGGCVFMQPKYSKELFRINFLPKHKECSIGAKDLPPDTACGNCHQDMMGIARFDQWFPKFGPQLGGGYKCVGSDEKYSDARWQTADVGFPPRKLLCYGALVHKKDSLCKHCYDLCVHEKWFKHFFSGRQLVESERIV